MGAPELETFKLLWIKHWGMEHKKQFQVSCVQLNSSIPSPEGLVPHHPRTEMVPPVPGRKFATQRQGCRQMWRMGKGTHKPHTTDIYRTSVL